MADTGKDPNVRVNIDGDITGLKRAASDAKPVAKEIANDLDAAGKAANDATSHFSLSELAVSRLGLAFGGAGTAIAGYLAGQSALVVKHIELAAATADLTQKYGMTAEELSSLSVGMVTGSTNAEQLGQGMKFLSTQMLQANSGNKEAQRTFNSLGLEWADGTGKLKPLNQMLEEIASRFEGMEDGAGKNALAAKLLGRSVGEQLIPYLNQGGDALKSLRQEAESLGLVISTKTAKDANDLSNNWKILKMGAGELAREITGPLVSALADITGAMRDARKEGDGWISTLLRGAREAVITLATVKPEAELAQLKVLEAQQIAHINKIEQGMAGNAQASDDKTKTPYQRLRAQQEAARAAAARDTALADLQANYKRQGEIEDYLYATDTSKPKGAAPNLDEKPGKEGRAAADNEAENTIKRLAEQYAVLNGEKSETEKLDRLLLETKKAWTPELAAEAYLIAGEIDEKKQLNKEADVALKNLARQEAAERAAEKAGEAHYDALKKEAQAVEESVDPFQKLSRETERLRVLVDEGVISWDTYYSAVSKAQEKAGVQIKIAADHSDEITSAVKNAVESNSRSLSRSLAEMAVSGEYSFKRLGDAARNFIQELLAIQIQKRTLDPLLKLGTSYIDSFFTGGGSQFGPAQNPADDWMLTGLSLPGRATGGPVFAGRGYMVGENGPEPFFPSENGFILPNGMLGAGGASPNVRVEIVNQGSQKMRVTKAAPSIDVNGAVVRVWLDDLRNNGPIAQALDRKMQGAF